MRDFFEPHRIPGARFMEISLRTKGVRSAACGKGFSVVHVSAAWVRSSLCGGAKDPRQEADCAIKSPHREFRCLFFRWAHGADGQRRQSGSAVEYGEWQATAAVRRAY